MTFAAEYQSSDQVKIARRPKRSARKPQRIVPTKRPVNRAAMKLRDARRPEEACGIGGQHARLDEARRDVSGEQQIVQFEEHAEAEQRQHGPDRSRGGQPVDPGRDRPGRHLYGFGRHVSSPNILCVRPLAFTRQREHTARCQCVLANKDRRRAPLASAGQPR